MDPHTQTHHSSPPPLVFVHGSGDSARCWDTILARLGLPPSAAFALDLPGHGSRAAEPPPAPTIAAYATALRDDLTSRGLGRVIVAGHSLGGAIALRLALDAPALVAGLALVGTGARLRVLPSVLDLARTNPTAAARDLATLGYAPDHAAMAAEYLAAPTPVAPNALDHDLTACDSFDVRDDLAHIAQPALVLVGDADRLTPPKYAQYLVEHMPHATLVTIPGAGHFLMHEAPETVVRALREWLAAFPT